MLKFKSQFWRGTHAILLTSFPLAIIFDTKLVPDRPRPIISKFFLVFLDMGERYPSLPRKKNRANRARARKKTAKKRRPRKRLIIITFIQSIRRIKYGSWIFKHIELKLAEFELFMQIFNQIIYCSNLPIQNTHLFYWNMSR